MTSPSDRTRLIASATRKGKGRRPVNPPLERASTMLSDRTETMHDDADGPTYGIEGLTAARELRNALSDLEGASASWIVASGLAAVTIPLMTFTRPGDEVLTSAAAYNPSRRFLSRWMTPRGVEPRYHPADADAATIADLVTDKTRILLIESPASLTMEVIDVAALAAAAREKGVLTIMDNTWAAGLAYKPLAHGIDISVQALTKYVSGHSDVMMGGIAVADDALARAIDGTINDMGWHVSPDDAWLTLRGLRTLPLRYAEQARSALTVATWLRDRPEVSRILYPALPGCEGHDLWRRDYTGAASLFGMVLKGHDTAAAQAFLDSLQLFGLGYSWGGFESLATHETGQFNMRPDAPTLEGELIRLHVGLEDPADLIADLEAGLAVWKAALG